MVQQQQQHSAQVETRILELMDISQALSGVLMRLNPLAVMSNSEWSADAADPPGSHEQLCVALWLWHPLHVGGRPYSIWAGPIRLTPACANAERSIAVMKSCICTTVLYCTGVCYMYLHYSTVLVSVTGTGI